MITIADLQAAHAALPSVVRRTPLLPSEELSDACRTRVFLKCENLQITGSYKARAAFTVLNRLSPEQKRRGAALSSSGNFAGAFAYMGRLLQVPTAIVMMEKTSPFKVEKCRHYGGEVVFCDDRYEARFETLDRLRDERGLTAINHLEDENVVIGHGTLGLEILEQLPEADLVLVPISTGGLIAGVATAVKQIRPEARVIGVQPEGSDAMYQSFREGRVVRIPKVETICDALTAQYPGTLTFEYARKYVDDIVLVPDSDIRNAMTFLAEYSKLVVEPGGAVTTAALQTGKVNVEGEKVVALLSGGNVPIQQIAKYS